MKQPSAAAALGAAADRQAKQLAWQELGQRNVQRLQELARQGINIGGIAEHWGESLWRAVVGDAVMDALHMQHEQWVNDVLDEQEANIQSARARAILMGGMQQGAPAR